jgi:nitroreductase
MLTTEQQNITVLEAINERRSVRGFLDKKIPVQTLQTIFEQAQQAPSNCNTQPWKVFVASGNVRDSISAQLLENVSQGIPQAADFSYKSAFEGEYRDRQVACAMERYSEMGVDRGDQEGRKKAMLRNFELFDAPYVAFLGMDKSFGETIAVDIGIYLQTLMLLMTSYGISSCAMGSLRGYPDVVRKAFDIDDSTGILLGISFGYEDPAIKANNTRISRDPVSNSVIFKNS